jgi:hypothetical protein
MNHRPNQAASGNGAMALLFHIGRLGRAVPEPRRWPSAVGQSILKGWRHSAQGCERRATLGNGREEPPTLKGLCPPGQPHAAAQAADATLSGLRVRGCAGPRVARSSQPWALRRNPVGIRKGAGGSAKKNMNGRPTRSLQATPGSAGRVFRRQRPGAPKLCRSVLTRGVEADTLAG